VLVRVHVRAGIARKIQPSWARWPFSMKLMSRAEFPLIAVNGLSIAQPEPSLRLAHRYADAVLKAGGIPLAIPPVGGPSDIERLLDNIDGLVLSGGDDFDTERLGLGPVHASVVLTDSAKQDFDFELVSKALERRIPVLGICYGMQVLGLAGGAKLIQDLPSERPEAREHRSGVVHDVIITPNSKLARVLGVERLAAVSRHHQALADVAGAWTVCAVDEQGLVEAIENPDQPFAVGVQWHPELADQGTAHDRLFQGLVGAAGMAFAQHHFENSSS
jgi:putative glutamine amidotransferase